LRAELLSVDQLERHAKGLAGQHELATGYAADRLLPRLAQNEHVLTQTYDLITAAVEKERRIAPAGEWLLDNFYLVEEQVRTTRKHLPRSYSRELPRLANGPYAGFPRVYAIALELIAHVDGRVEQVSLTSFIAAYQTVSSLTLGELWAIPIMVRLALIENLRRVAARINSARSDRDAADDWAERMVKTVEKNPTDLILALADMARANPPLSSAFVTELTRHLQGQSPYFSFAVSWLEHRVFEQGQTIAQLVQAESQAQAADQVSIGNSITSLRFLGAMDWRKFVESMSAVEQTLYRDPAGVYADMDFATRDQYRHAIEEIAKRSRFSELEIARKSVQLAEAAWKDHPHDRTAHVGYYLVDRGRPALEGVVAMRSTIGMAASRIGRRFPLFFYLGGVILMTAIVTALMIDIGFRHGVPWQALVALAIPILICASQLAVGVANWFSTVMVAPKSLPRMDFSRGIPPEFRTMVVVPTMLSRPEAIEDLLEHLEIRYLANREKNLHFALLTDFADAPQAQMPGDDDLIAAARAGIEGLNGKYAPNTISIFYLFHRARAWNEQEGVWMGFERKRGKIADFNSLCRGGGGGKPDKFSVIEGDTSILPTVKYAITLDTDTQLPRDSARTLIGAMAHPLNQPRYDTEKRRVTEGYTILQPRVGVSLPSANRSMFSRLFAGEPGIDPYTRAVSDVYQDVFGEGSFIGKGIYDIDAFERSCRSFPDNAILSHDLLESTYARSALISDVELFEEFPSQFQADVSRRHRWIRGDWQIIYWLMRTVPGPQTQLGSNPASALSRWKIFDNLRRSLVPASLLVVLLAGWLLLGEPMGWDLMLFVLGVLAVPLVLAIVAELVRRPAELPLIMHLSAAFGSAARQAGQAAFLLVFLPYDAYISLDAVIRTLIRLTITRRKLLEWQTSSDAERHARTRMIGYWRSMWFAPAVAALTLAMLIWRWPIRVGFTAPILAAWYVSPAVAWWLSRPIARMRPDFSPAQVSFLRQVTRRTWRFFETFVTAEEHWLPPDNFQENPGPVVASRTSPTNIGMALLAQLAAYDFGYLTAGAMLQNIGRTFDTLESMERYRGHFYNWYDTRSLRPLPPAYVSMVDSGNLVGHLMVLSQGLIALADEQILSNQAFPALSDTLDALRNRIKAVRSIAPASADALRRIDRMVADLAHPPTALTAAYLLLSRLTTSSSEIAGSLSGIGDAEAQWWADALARESRARLDDLRQFAPWAALPPPSDAVWRGGGAGGAGITHRLEEMRSLLQDLENIPTFAEVAELHGTTLPAIDAVIADLHSVAGVVDPGLPAPQTLATGSAQTPPAQQWLHSLRQAVADATGRAAERIAVANRLADRSRELADMDFSFMLDRSRDLYAIGFNVADHRLDSSFYDLLASEARLGSYVTIAQGQVPQEHWFNLGRLLTSTRGAAALLSWSGSMFEYLMPLLVMPTYESTLLDQTYHSVVRRQIDYGEQRGVPWGMSESGYHLTDAQLNYQYRAFGVPGLGLKRGLADDLVIAPYASVMALMVAPHESCRNLQRLDADGRQGPYGFYEAIDYTPARIPRGQTCAVVQSWMAHHQGMSLLSLAYVLLDRPMQRRFAADPLLRAADLLLHERVPKIAPVYPHTLEAATRSHAIDHQGTMRVFADVNTPTPEVHLLSNGRFHAMVSAAGGGYSRWKDIALTRWREDPTRDSWGSFCYVRDVETGTFWSTAFQPTLKVAKPYEAIFTQARAEFRRRDEEIETHTEISVSPEDDIELRRVRISNHSDKTRTIELTSYMEVVLAPAAADAAHPAFSNLFVQSQILRNHDAILCTRRARSMGEKPPWMFHLMSVHGQVTGTASFETDRSKFIGRGRTPTHPLAMVSPAALSDSDGSVLDPVACIRQTIVLEPDQSARIDLVLGAADTREAALALVEKYHDVRLADRVLEMAWTHSQVVLQHLNANEADAQVYGRLAGSVVYPTSHRRAAASVIIRNHRGQSGLWGYGISGDLPIVLLRIRDSQKLELVRHVLQAHAYWRLKGLSVDLVVWNDDETGYRQNVNDAIMGMIAAGPEAGFVDKPGGVFVRRGEQISDEDRVLLQTVARVVLSDDAGTLAEQVDRRGRAEISIPALKPTRTRRTEPPVAAEVPRREMQFFNGIGGFTKDGREYVTTLTDDGVTPAPWVNVMANPQFGTVISESGSAYSWSENSHEFRLTPWFDDPVSDPNGEALYLRDEESGRFWSPTPQPTRGPMAYTSRHGWGYSVFEYSEDGISSELTIFVSIDSPVKFARLRINNLSGRPRRLSATAYYEWVLGELRHKTMMHVVTEIDPKTNAVFARNNYNSDFPGRVAFVATSEATRTVTGDRTEFLGRNGTRANPAALRRLRLSGRVGAGFDPCTAVQVPIELGEGQQRDVVFLMGSAANVEQAQNLVQRFRGTSAAQSALQAVWDFWNRTLGTVHVETPDPAVNFLANGWLLYQVISSRLWGRSGFYQSGGAFGFRDQLQDVAALLQAGPWLMREQILRAASRQFKQGDVQHWWHPPQGRGVRTHFSDDYLWLPWVTCRYVIGTGDTGVLDEKIHYLDGRAVRPDEEAYYDLPQISDEVGTLYDHCVRAVKNGLRFGDKGLPLMGCGDWNDGMNLVGEHGKGQSVWLAFFLYDVLIKFGELASRRGDSAFAAECTEQATTLKNNIEQHAWDGSWYIRAFFDNGEPLGSHTNDECQIDSLPQSWSILSGAGQPDRSKQALDEVNKRLVKRDAGLIQLFDPPFDKSSLNPGYIRGYVPGVRENGGQYTHAAVWTVMAYAASGDVERTWELFNLINPVYHGETAGKIAKYKVEPYVVAADVYAVPPHVGRGGWTWYTGSAGWLYRLIAEQLLGMQLEVNVLRFAPLPHKDWKSYVIHYRYRETVYHITLTRTGPGSRIGRVLVDNVDQPEQSVRMVDDRREHQVSIEFG
jgi:cyclic beta-1,2-glucan synthetase